MSTNLVPFHSEPTYSPLLLLSRIKFMKNSPVFEFNLSAIAGDTSIIIELFDIQKLISKIDTDSIETPEVT